MIRVRRAVAVTGVGLLASTLIGGCDWGSLSGEDEAPVRTSEGHWDRVGGPTRGANGLQQMVPVAVGNRVVLIAGASYDRFGVKGFILDLGSRRWSHTAPSRLGPRFGFSAVLAGDRVILWGGCCGPAGRGSRAPGAIYDLATDSWMALGPGPLGNRYFHTAVWTGREMIVWGGLSGDGGVGRPEDLRADGAAYDPRSGEWRRIAPAPLSPRQYHVAVWSGKEMLVWGGSAILRPLREERERLLYDGAAYNPKADRWRPLPDTKALVRPSPILPGGVEPNLYAGWTGEEMIIWSPSGGALFEPRDDEWTEIPVAPPGLRYVYGHGPKAIWAGDELIVWGIEDNRRDFIAEGAAYDPEAKQWAALPEAPIVGRVGHAAIWTGEEMLVWGGFGADGRYRANGAVYVPE
jgi:hypothetical protein